MGKRKSVRSSLKSVRELRSQCHFPPTCPKESDTSNLVAMHQRCGGAAAGGWQAALPVGDYSQLTGNVCDNDKGMCIVPNCPVKPRTVQSLEVPAGLEVRRLSACL